MPNPFTRFINRSNPGSDLARFIAAWDDLEELLIAVYRRGRPEAPESLRWETLRSDLRKLYPSVRTVLAPHWPAHSPDDPDPVLAALELGSLDEMPGNLALLKTLPNIREAINRSLLSD
jgi:hypothetical protein